MTENKDVAVKKEESLNEFNTEAVYDEKASAIKLLELNSKVFDNTKLNISLSYIDENIKFKDRLVSMIKSFQSIDKERVIFYLESDIKISSFSNNKTFIMAKFELIDKLLTAYRGVLGQFTEDLIPYIKGDLKTTSSYSNGFNFFGLGNQYYKKDLHDFMKYIEDISRDLVTENETFKTQIDMKVWGLKEEINLQEWFSDYEFTQMKTDPELIRAWLNKFTSSNYLSYEPIPIENQQFIPVYLMRKAPHNYLLDLMKQDVMSRKVMMDILDSIMYGQYFVTKLTALTVYKDLLKNLRINLNILSDDQSIPSRVALGDIQDAIFGIVACTTQGLFRRMSLNLEWGAFSTYNPLLLMSILVMMALCPDYCFTDRDKIKMSNYVFYFLIGRIKPAFLATKVIDLKEYREGDADMFTTIPIKSKSELCDVIVNYIPGELDNRWSQDGLKKEVMLDDKFAEFYPGRTLWYSPIYMNEEGIEVSEGDATPKLIKLEELLTAIVTTEGIFKVDKSEKDSAFVAIAVVLLASLKKTASFMVKLQMIIKAICAAPLCNPVSLGNKEYESMKVRLAPIKVFDAAFCAVPLSVNDELTKIKVQNINLELFRYSGDINLGLTELAEKLAWVLEHLPKPLFNSQDRVDFAFANLKYKSPLHQVIKDSILQTKNFGVYLKLKHKSEYVMFRDKIQEFVDMFQPSVFGYVDRFYYISNFVALKNLSTTNGNAYSLMYLFNPDKYIRSFIYKDDQDIIQDISDNKLKDRVDDTMSVINPPKYIEYTLPTQVKLNTFVDLRDFSDVKNPVGYSSNRISYGSLNVYVREKNEILKDIDSSNSFVYSGPPKFVINEDQLTVVKIGLSDLDNFWLTTKVYTKDFARGIVKTFPVIRTSIFSDLYES